MSRKICGKWKFEWIWRWNLCYFFKGFGGDNRVNLRVNFVKVYVGFE